MTAVLGKSLPRKPRRSLLGQWPLSSSRYWRSWTLRPVTLSITILIAGAFVACLLILQGLSDRNGGVAFAANEGNFSPKASFGFLILPTIIAVCFSLLWSWIDLDVKRLEPWYQLSGDFGVQAKASLLIQYPVDFVAVVPVRAVKRG